MPIQKDNASVEMKEYVGYQQKRNPTALQDLAKSKSIPEYLSLEDRQNKLLTQMGKSPYQCYSVTLTTEFAKAYSSFGTFGRGSAERQAAAQSVADKRPYVVDHLLVMDEITQRAAKQ